MVYIQPIHASTAKRLALGLTGNIAKDLDWLEATLKKGNEEYLGGDHVVGGGNTIAFSIIHLP